ncbi:hypothetical protein Q0Z83_011500 [Actinoplanes sichuanensis]|uniref:Uncharacterized protein n=1 Tax=Actinoplanes sichuanensis TaxID=512349 RepID=A0ABW4APS7_9ACTN|nr:hypothetical protein [Actinoplanes sichuanensis]BEL02959.1 hypothetical protein Q0Z83_011500 [Actinoplanes sichuanensis]
MTTDRLTELLEQSSADVSPPSFAATAWATARRVRRRRQVMASVAAFAAVVAVTVPLRDRGGDDIVPAPPAPSATPSVPTSGVDVMPEKPVRRALAPLPADFTIPADAPRLSGHPVERAVAVVQENDPDSADRSMRPLHVLDAAGQWVRIDVGELGRTHDESGNEADPLRGNSLSPDGRRVAVPQPDALVVIDLPAAKVHRIPVPGLNEQVMWSGNGVVFVGQGSAGVVRVDWATGVVTPEPAAMSAWNGGGSAIAPAEIAELIGADGGRAVRVWRPGEADPVRAVPVDFRLVKPSGYGVSEWEGPAVPDGVGRIAAAAWGDHAPSDGSPQNYGGVQMLTVVDTTTGLVERLLDLGSDRWKSCCRALDWIDDGQTLLAQTEREGLITWNTRTGEITQITAGPFRGTISMRLP